MSRAESGHWSPIATSCLAKNVFVWKSKITSKLSSQKLFVVDELNLNWDAMEFIERVRDDLLRVQNKPQGDFSSAISPYVTSVVVTTFFFKKNKI